MRVGSSDRAEDNSDAVSEGSSAGEAARARRDFQIEDVDGYEVDGSVRVIPRILPSIEGKGMFLRAISNVSASAPAPCTTIIDGFTSRMTSRNSSCFEISSRPKSTDTIVNRRIAAVHSRIVYSIPLGMNISIAVFGRTLLSSIPLATRSAAR